MTAASRLDGSFAPVRKLSILSRIAKLLSTQELVGYHVLDEWLGNGAGRWVTGTEDG